MMVLPMACAVMRQVFSQTPQGEREAALALGATKWGMVRAVVLPFGRGGIIGGTMLGLGRALGETIAVVLIISPAFEIKPNILEIGTNTVCALIAGRFGEASAVAALGAARRRLRAVPHHPGRQHARRGDRQPQPLRRGDRRMTTHRRPPPTERRRRRHRACRRTTTTHRPPVPRRSLGQAEPRRAVRADRQPGRPARRWRG